MNNNLRGLIKVSLLIGSVISLVFVPWALLFAWFTPLPDTVQQEVTSALAHEFDGIIVYVDKKGQRARSYAAGWHNRELKVPANSQALFKIASISKLYDAVAVSKLVAAGRLSLDETLAHYLPELKTRIQYADKITLRMLLQHRSGIPNFTDVKDYWKNPPANAEQALALVLDLTAKFKPDEKYDYSNSNYLLISKIMEKVLGYDHFQFIKDEILVPLGLKHTFRSIQDVDKELVMSGYYVGVEHDLKMENESMIASAEDVGVFLRALNEGSVFNNGEQQLYTNLYKYEHTGLIPGYQSIAKYHKEIDTVVVQFVNTTNFDGDTWALSEIVYNRIVKIVSNNN
ncbi:serine hydrolase domain-containing protein [Arsukibacterium tuosuense]|uniref:serine hydrolase domain-containing protein n=1 Tax=Arsukibacterium tuosuense TaxID=1323745 RepID=UPI001BB02015|nr:serine hydrolase domain-containing protein [Arsukibacterium tuosuense]